MIISCNMIVDRRDQVQYLTVSKSYSDNCTCSLTEQNTTLKNLYYGLILFSIQSNKAKNNLKLKKDLSESKIDHRFNPKKFA